MIKPNPTKKYPTLSPEFNMDTPIMNITNPKQSKQHVWRRYFLRRFYWARVNLRFPIGFLIKSTIIRYKNILAPTRRRAGAARAVEN